MERNNLGTGNRYFINTNTLRNRHGIYKTETFSVQSSHTITTSYCQLLKAKGESLSSGNSNLASECLNIIRSYENAL